MLAFLAAAGQAGLIGSGARLVLQGVEHATGLPVYSTLRNAAAQAIGDVRSLATPVLETLGGPDLARLADPARQFRTVGPVLTAGSMTVQEYATQQARKNKKLEAQLAAEHQAAADAAAQQALDAANAATAQAEAKARDLESQLARAKTDSQRRTLKVKARGARRWSKIANAFQGQTVQAKQAGADSQTILDLALKALSAAQAANNPPADARHILASDQYTDAEKSAAQYAIDGVNRDDPLDVEAIVRRLSSDDAQIREEAEEEFIDAAEGLSGHDHHHGAAGCSCGGACGACSARSKQTLAGKDDGWSYDSRPVLAGKDDGWSYDSTDDTKARAALAGAPSAGDGWSYDSTTPKGPTALAGAPSAADSWNYSSGGAADHRFHAALEKASEDEDCGCGG